MPELPEIDLYIDALERTVGGQILEAVRVRSPSLLKTYDPPLRVVEGKRIVDFRRLGKRIVMEAEGDLFLVIHLMLTGRLFWRKAGVAIPQQGGQAAFDFSHGSLLLMERGKEKKASLHILRGEAALRESHPGGIEPLEADLPAFEAALRERNGTLKKVLTDPRAIAGIGNAYSDEILLRARLSPARLTARLSTEETERLYTATQSTLSEWKHRLREEAGERFPEKVTAFHPQMAAHGRFGKPCPQCGTPIQRIVYASGETNYCPTCQTGGRLLADRALSRLLGEDWPRTTEKLEQMRRSAGGTDDKA
jgi:formamidopyrimidine-DNA glycosylase